MAIDGGARDDDGDRAGGDPIGLSFADAVEAGLAAAAPPPPAIDLCDAGWNALPGDDALFRLDWSALDEVLRWLLVKSGRLAQDLRVSVLPVWQAACGRNPAHYPPAAAGLLGERICQALDLARNTGVLREDLWPAVGAKCGGDPLRQMFASAARLRIAGYCPLEPRIAHWRTWIANNGPILARAGHAVAIVGYTPGSIIVCDSWQGGGTAHLANAEALATLTEVYGIVV